MIQTAQIIFILSVLVILHEFGHYITAKIFKVRVEKFYLFMDAGFSLVKKKIGDTEWGIGWLPIGGYVKLSGMMDESMDSEQLKQPAQPWEFRSKPAWQRLIIMLGGIFVNIVLALVIYTTLFSTVGQKYISLEKVQKDGLAYGDVGQKVGFKNGDKIVSIDGEFIPDLKYAVMGVLFGDNIKVNRDGKEINLHLTDSQKGEIIRKEGKSFIQARIKLDQIFIDSITNSKSTSLKRFDKVLGINEVRYTYYDEVLNESKLHKNDYINLLVNRDGKDLNIMIKTDSLGTFTGNNIFINQNYNLSDLTIKEIQNNESLKSGDIIISANGKISNIDFKKQLEENKGKSILLKIKRDNKTINVVSKINKSGKLGIKFDNSKLDKYTVVNKMSFFNSINEAVRLSWSQIIYNINSFKLILRPATGAYTQVKSPIGIARMLPDEWDWEFIWGFTALFSIGLAFMNLLPIPGLDGGHALFTIVEMITGKTLNEKAAGYVQTFGMIILLSLMALTFGKDIYQLVVDKLL
ncbi:site-2 protease family protein [Flavobacterium sp.]|uniref:site-2 protease family protein n=1 Tax=Flavobacterium sp. TaxID=239 RepID=UPI003753092D